MKLRHLKENCRSYVKRLSIIGCLAASLSGWQAFGAAGDVDTGFAPNVLGDVYAIAVQADSKILVAGNMTKVGAFSNLKLARLQPDGTLDTAFKPSPNGTVYGLGLQTDGCILVVGSFTKIGTNACTNIARLYPDGTLDKRFNPNPNDAVYSVAFQEDQKAIVTGNFYQIGGLACRQIARLNTDGTVDASFMPSLGPIAPTAVAIQADGMILVGGTTVAYTSVGLLRFYPDGTQDTAFKCGVTGSVTGIRVQRSGTILLSGGTFYDSSRRNFGSLVRLTSAGSLYRTGYPVANWSPGMVFQADGNAILSGPFSLIDSVPRAGLARIQADGTLDTSFAPIKSGTTELTAIQADGSVLVTGFFTVSSGRQCSGLTRLYNNVATQSIVVAKDRVRWLRSGAAPEVDQVSFEFRADQQSAWILLGSGSQVDGGWECGGLSLPHDGWIRVRGRTLSGNGSGIIEQVTQFGDFPDIRVGITGTNLNNGTTVAFPPGTPGIIGSPLTLTVTNAGGLDLTISSVSLSGSGSNCFVLNRNGLPNVLKPGQTGGVSVAFVPVAEARVQAILEFSSNDAQEPCFSIGLSGVASWVDASFAPNPNGPVYGVALQPDKKMLLVGNFLYLGKSYSGSVVRLNPDGTPDSTFIQVGESPTCVAVQNDGKIILGGSHLLRLDARGFRDTAWGSYAGPIHGITIQTDEKALVWGEFLGVGRAARPGLARLNVDGTLDQDFNPALMQYARCNSVLIEPDGKILVGGQNPYGTPYFIARLNPDGTTDGDFHFELGYRPGNFAITANGKVVIGSLDGGLPELLQENGTVDPSFQPSSLLFSSFTSGSIAVRSDGQIVFGGSVKNESGGQNSFLASVGANGTATSESPSMGGTSIQALALDADGQVLVGGTFKYTNATSQIFTNFIRMSGAPATQSLTIDGTRVQWLRGGGAPEVQQVTFETSTDSGANWKLVAIPTRIPGGWEQTGTPLPPSGLLRARGRTSGGQYNGSSGLVEQVIAFSFQQQLGVISEGTALVDAVSVVPFGAVDFGRPGATVSFTVTNLSSSTLALGSVTISGTGAADFILKTNGIAQSLAPFQTSTFAVMFVPLHTGTRTASVHIATTDSTGSVFDFDVTGSMNIGTATAPHQTNGIFHVGFSGTAGFKYSVQWAPTVSGPWSSFTNLNAGTNGIFDLFDTPGNQQRYFRVLNP